MIENKQGDVFEPPESGEAGNGSPDAKPLTEAKAQTTVMSRNTGESGRVASPRTPSLYSGHSLVPRETVPGQALLTVIAIMSFLACLTLGMVSVVRDMAAGWQSDISREITVQIRPLDGLDLDGAVRTAGRILLSFDGVEQVTALNDVDSAALLEPFLGAGVQVDELPVPALLTVTLTDGVRPDFTAMAQALEDEIPGVSLDDHRGWVDRLTAMANTTVIAGLVVFLLVLVATVMTVIFATRGAMSGNRDIVEVLHFVGADRKFIAKEFETHFLRLGLIGALGGGIAAILIFVGLRIWTSTARSSPQAEQITALFGTFSIGLWAILAIVITAVSIAVLTGLTSRYTVLHQIARLETYGGRQ